jgi:hypothetical protein
MKMRSVTFDTIVIHVFAPAIGDHPFVKGGVPLTLGVKLQETVVSLDQYEQERAPRRSRQELIHHREVRKAM